jgi:hypothetical protein
VFDFRLVSNANLETCQSIYIYGIDPDARSIQQKKPCTTERNFSQWAQCIQSAGENYFPLSAHLHALSSRRGRKQK